MEQPRKPKGSPNGTGGQYDRNPHGAAPLPGLDTTADGTIPDPTGREHRLGMLDARMRGFDWYDPDTVRDHVPLIGEYGRTLLRECGDVPVRLDAYSAEEQCAVMSRLRSRLRVALAALGAALSADPSQRHLRALRSRLVTAGPDDPKLRPAWPDDARRCDRLCERLRGMLGPGVRVTPHGAYTIDCDARSGSVRVFLPDGEDGVNGETVSFSTGDPAVDARLPHDWDMERTGEGFAQVWRMVCDARRTGHAAPASPSHPVRHAALLDAPGDA